MNPRSDNYMMILTFLIDYVFCIKNISYTASNYNNIKITGKKKL